MLRESQKCVERENLGFYRVLLGFEDKEGKIIISKKNFKNINFLFDILYG